jgi:hypothetical protein
VDAEERALRLQEDALVQSQQAVEAAEAAAGWREQLAQVGRSWSALLCCDRILGSMRAASHTERGVRCRWRGEGA